jgi:hypothetical protein
VLKTELTICRSQMNSAKAMADMSGTRVSTSAKIKTIE